MDRRQVPIPPAVSTYKARQKRTSRHAVLHRTQEMAAPPGEDAARSPTCWPTRVGGVRPRVEPDGEGGRLAFGPDGYLYICTGDADQRDPAQDKNTLNGKILRVTQDGAPAPGNPFPRSPVWSLGHRNVEGMAWTRTRNQSAGPRPGPCTPASWGRTPGTS
jgi:glucose/arabinose dehydrogenase